MLYPTIDQLTKDKYNRYELALATAKCARLITDEYVRQHDVAERSITGNKETDKPLNTMIDRELRDEKAVRVAIKRISSGEFEIDPQAGTRPPITITIPMAQEPYFAPAASDYDNDDEDKGEELMDETDDELDAEDEEFEDSEETETAEDAETAEEDDETEETADVSQEDAE